VTYPGGCEIGLRPIDLHIKGLGALGVKIREEHGRIYCDGEKLRGGYVTLGLSSCGRN
jgi:UDP-N-acetylglucosamine 1-carboxyvinyltransferase